MKKVLAMVAVVALVSVVASASTTLHVWTELVTATYMGNNTQGTPQFVYGGPAAVGPNMALGYYGVQIWAEVLGANENNLGIESMAVTLYTVDTQNAFVPVINPWKPTDNPKKNVVTFNPAIVSDFSCIAGAVSAWNDPRNTSYNSTVKDDAVQLSIGGGGNYTGVGAPILIATEAWNLLSHDRVTLAAYVAPTSRYYDWDGTTLSKLNFNTIVTDSMVIPEPITMAMVGMGLCGLGMFIRRRVKENA